VTVPYRTGLGIEVDMAALDAANDLYKKQGLGTRDDAIATQYLVSGSRFDNKKPCWFDEAG